MRPTFVLRLKACDKIIQSLSVLLQIIIPQFEVGTSYPEGRMDCSNKSLSVEF